MSEHRLADMLEATRLTRAGRLAEATALLQRTAGTASPSDTAAERRSWAVTDALRNWSRRAGSIVRPKPAPSPPNPEPGPDDGQFLTRSYHGDAGTLGYRLYVPGGYRGKPVPLVVMLHGCKQSAADFATGTRMNAYADDRVFLAAYPEQPSTANGSRCWNWFKPEHQQRGAGEAAVIAGITEQVMREFAVDPRRVYVAGLSAGGAAAAILGAAYPDLFAGVGIHSGLACGAAHSLVSAFAVMREGGPSLTGLPADAAGRVHRVPTIVFHGDRDRTVNPRNGEQALAQAMGGSELEKNVERGDAPGGRSYTRTRYTDRNGTVMFEAWTIHGAGHAWSGGNPAGSYTDPQGPDATREMLRFFLGARH